MNQNLISYLEKGLFDSLVFPQDDTSEYGLNIREQEQLYKIRNEKQLFNKMLIYPGADEVASVLTARMIYALEGEKDRKSTRLNSSHVATSYAVFCLKK